MRPSPHQPRALVYTHTHTRRLGNQRSDTMIALCPRPPFFSPFASYHSRQRDCNMVTSSWLGSTYEWPVCCDIRLSIRRQLVFLLLSAARWYQSEAAITTQRQTLSLTYVQLDSPLLLCSSGSFIIRMLPFLTQSSHSIICCVPRIWRQSCFRLALHLLRYRQQYQITGWPHSNWPHCDSWTVERLTSNYLSWINNPLLMKRLC